MKGAGSWRTYNIPMIIPLLLIAFALQTSAHATDKTTELLRAKDQALLDAIAPGDRKVWEQALAADAVFVDEIGVIMDRAEFLKQLEPLSPGASGTRSEERRVGKECRSRWSPSH